MYTVGYKCLYPGQKTTSSKSVASTVSNILSIAKGNAIRYCTWYSFFPFFFYCPGYANVTDWPIDETLEGYEEKLLGLKNCTVFRDEGSAPYTVYICHLGNGGEKVVLLDSGQIPSYITYGLTALEVSRRHVPKRDVWR